MLQIDAVDASYGKVQILHDLSLIALPGQVTCLMGRNGAGKTTTLRAIMGQVQKTNGSIRLNGEDISKVSAHDIPKKGIGYVPQGRRLFGEMTVAENLEIGLMTLGHGSTTRDRVLEMFPRLRERMAQQSRTLSGGEQQMLAIARTLCIEPRVLLLDEPTEGLQPSMITMIKDTILALKSMGVAIILVEQRVDAVLTLADQIAFMVGGRVMESVPAIRLTKDAAQFRKYIGI